MSTIRTYANPAKLADEAARYVVAAAQGAVAAHGRFSLALSGGSTPRALFARLTRSDLAGQVDWAATHVFWGDERAVPPDHDESNYRMAKAALLDHVPLPPENVHRIQGELEPQAAAAAYEAELRDFFAAGQEGNGGRARFDLVLLGMGSDGHTASLFPGAEGITEKRRWVAAYHVEKLDAWRITLTPVAINAAARVVFVVAGAGKAEQLRQVLYGPHKPEVLPAQVVAPEDGRLLWLIDNAAAGSL